MSTERGTPDDRPAGEGPDVTRFFLAEPRSATDPEAPTVSADTATEADPKPPAAHAFRVGVAVFHVDEFDLFTGEAVRASADPVPALFFRSTDPTCDPDEWQVPVPAAAACSGPDGLRAAAERALYLADVEAEELEWRRGILRALVAAEAIGSDWSPS